MSFLTFLDKNFNGSKYRFKKAVELIGEKKYAEAESILIDISGTHSEVEIKLDVIKYEKAKNLIANKNYSGALDLLEKIISTDFIPSIEPILLETKYNRAIELHKEENISEAITLLETIIFKHSQAYKKLDEIRLEIDIKNVSRFKKEGKYTEAESILERIKHTPQLAIELAEVKYKIFDLLLEKCDALKATEKLKEIRIINDKLEWEKDKNKLKPIISECHNKIGSFYYRQGKDFEKLSAYDQAKESYYQAKIRFDKIKDIEPEKYSNALSRYEIVKLKQDIEPDKNIISLMKSQSLTIQNDFFYRLVLLLSKKNKLSEAEQLLNEHFKKSSVNEIEQLRTFIKNDYDKVTKKLLSDYNTLVTQINNTDYPVSITLYEFWQQKIDQYKNNKKFIESGFVHEINKVLPYLRKKILFNLLVTKNYEAAIDFIASTYSKFYLNPELVKINGIAAFRLACDDKITNSNYKKTVSSFLIYAYSISVICESVKSTEWYIDSEISFSLVGTKYISNPDFCLYNLNHKDISDKNISIKDSQNELIEDFERQLQIHITDIMFYEEVKSFYNNEKKNISEIIGYISKDSLMFTPHFADRHNLSLNILEELNQVYIVTSDEKILGIGIYYITNNKTSPSIFLEYRSAEKTVDSIINAVKKRSINIFQTYFIEKNILLIKRFKSTVKLEVVDLDNMQLLYLHYLKFICLDEEESNIKELTTCIRCVLEQDYLKKHTISSSQSSQLFLILDSIILVNSRLVKKLCQTEYNSFVYFIKQYGDYFHKRIIGEDSNLSDQDKRYRNILDYWRKLSGS